jgi:MoxR-like ATPase
MAARIYPDRATGRMLRTPLTSPIIRKAATFYPALLPALANRHGLITGATGTGKTA